VLVNDLVRVEFITSSVHNAVWNAYSSLNIMLILTVITNVALFVLGLCAFLLQSRRLILVIAFTIPLIGALLWVTDGTVYGLWITARDVCDASAAYIASPTQEQLASQISLELVPCLDPRAAKDLAENGKHAYVAMIQRANSIITGCLLLYDSCPSVIPIPQAV
jgi:ABC-type multidrug transport system fused ATPase/permease subunit